MQFVDVDKHITVKAFEDRVYYQRSLVTSYICVCNNELFFTTRDFYRHINLNFSNLSKLDLAKISQLTLSSTEVKQNYHFLDFYCPNCRIPVRIYYSIEQRVGSKWEAYRYQVKALIIG